jgi:hypothetical protein
LLLYPGTDSPSAAPLLSFLFITREYRMLKRVLRTEPPGAGEKQKEYFRFS